MYFLHNFLKVISGIWKLLRLKSKNVIPVIFWQQGNVIVHGVQIKGLFINSQRSLVIDCVEPHKENTVIE